MQQINLTKSLKIDVFDKNEYLEQNKEVNDTLKKVLSSYKQKNDSFEQHDAIEYIDNLSGNIFFTKLEIKIFVLKSGQYPISFSIFSKKSESSWNLQLFWTDSEYTKLGFATILLRCAVASLREDKAENIFVVADKKNIFANHLFESFGKVVGVGIDKKEDKEKITFKFNIEKAKSENLIEDAKKLAIK